MKVENTNKKIIITFSTKGGVGKSSLCGGVVDYIRRYKKEGDYAIYDGDISTLSLFNHFSNDGIKDPFKSVDYFNTKDGTDVVNLIQYVSDMRIDKPNVDTFVFDLPGGIDDSIASVWGDGAGLIEQWQGMDFEVFILIPVSYSYESVAALGRAYELFGNQPDKYVVFKNKAGGQKSMKLDIFETYDVENYEPTVGGKTFQDFAINILGATICDYPILDANTFAKWGYMHMSYSDVWTYFNNPKVISKKWGPFYQGALATFLDELDTVIQKVIFPELPTPTIRRKIKQI